MSTYQHPVLIDARLATRGLGIGAFVQRLMEGFTVLGGPPPAVWCALERAGRSTAAPTLARSGLFDVSPRLDPRTRRYRVVHYASNVGSWFPGIRSVLTVYDLLCRRRLRTRDRVYDVLLSRALPRVGRIVAISTRTADAVVRALPALAQRIEVIPPGMRAMSTTAPRRHILAFGGVDPRKRLGLVVVAYRHYQETFSDPLPLVVVARAGLSDDVRRSLRAVGARIENDASRAEVDVLMAQAAVLIHSSMEEGFGLPVLEAAECGTPVVLQTGAGLAAEALGRHCYPVDGTHPSAWAAGILRAIQGGPVPDALDLPDWTEVARRYRSIYEDLAA